MAKDTNILNRQKMIYQVFPRQYSKTKDFKGVTKDLDRIKNLGTDIIYLLPIHPIGLKARKGSVGSPYAISDYYQVNPDYGTLEDLKELVDGAHKRNMEVMIDIVINHTSRDSVLTKEHPEWFYRDEQGNFKNRVGDWSDVTDLDYNKREVWNYMINYLKYWAKYVDGYRCDVAPLLPIEFWLEAREEVKKIKPNFFWLTESVHPGFIKYLRDEGYDAYSDAEMYQAFDACYDYDIDDYFKGYLNNKSSLARYLEEVLRQEMVFPKNYLKIRHLENHDQERIASFRSSEYEVRNLTALSFFIRGMGFVYAGQEFLNTNRPSLFELDLIDFKTGKDISKLIKRLSEIKKSEDGLITGAFNVLENQNFATMKYESKEHIYLGYFDLESTYEATAHIKEGIYNNLIDNQKVIVKNDQILSKKFPIIIKIDKEGN